MAQELADKKTPVTVQEMADALYRAWCRYFGGPPEKKSIMVLLAQWALETGRGKHMHNYNVGNVKTKPDGEYDYQYFACNELLKTDNAKKLQAESSNTARITRDNGNGTCWIWFYPKHQGCCFRAFSTLDDGVFDHLVLLANHARFKQAWPAVSAGSPEQFSKLLRKAGYYTAPEETYTAGVVKLFNEFNGSIKLPDPPTFTTAQARETRNAVTMSLRRMSAEMMSAVRRGPDED